MRRVRLKNTTTRRRSNARSWWGIVTCLHFVITVGVPGTLATSSTISSITSNATIVNTSNTTAAYTSTSNVTDETTAATTERITTVATTSTPISSTASSTLHNSMMGNEDSQTTHSQHPGDNQCPEDVLWATIGSVAAVVTIAIIIAVCLMRRRRWSKPVAFTSAAFSNERTEMEGSDTSLASVFIMEASAATDQAQQKPNSKPVIAVTPLDNRQTNSKGARNSRHVDSFRSASLPSAHSTRTPTPRLSQELLLEECPTTSGRPNSSLVENGRITLDRKNACDSFRRSVPALNAVQAYLIDRLEFGQLEDDFKAIPIFVKNAPRTVCTRPENGKKNRFQTVLPYDENRVVLNDGYTEDQATDYVNASYISGFQREKVYIAAQGPKENTVDDFWRMIWQEEITHIVMLTNLRERGKDKCSLYWPDADGGEESQGRMETYGPMTVISLSVEKRDTFYIRMWSVTREGSSETRDITQYHYVSWPDFGVPTTASLVSFWRYVTANIRSETVLAMKRPPLLVHCSAGVGRTGTLIALDIAMQQAVNGRQLDLIDLVTSLRHQRCLMVQAVAQFEFLHTAILEAYSSRETVISVDDLNQIFTTPVDFLQPHTRIDKEFAMLMEMKSLAPDVKCMTAREKENRDKNRDLDILLADENVPFLIESVPGRGNYISATYMPTFRDPRGSLMTQLPLPSTLVDFWRLVKGDNVSIIISLSSPNEEQETESYCRYWPRSEGEVIVAEPYTISFRSVSQVSECLKSYEVSVSKNGQPTPSPVQILHYDAWTGDTGDSPKDLLMVVDKLASFMSEHPNSRYIVQCTDGVRKSGLFCALCDIISRITYDRQVDIYMSVRRVQGISLRAVTSVVQYRYLYEAARQRCGEMSMYVNEL